MFGIRAGGRLRKPANIDIREPGELAYWSEALEVDEPTLRGAIQAVGFTARDVRGYLEYRRSVAPSL